MWRPAWLSRGFCDSVTGIDMRELLGASLLCLGLVGLLVSYWLIYGLGLKAGLIAAVAAALLATGVVLDRSRGRMLVCAVGLVMGCGWLYVALTL